MSLVHSYRMQARPGAEDELGAALEALAEAVRSIAGSQGAIVLQDRKDAAKFLFLEYWDSEGSRNAAGPQLPKDVMGRVMASQGGPIEMTLWDRRTG